MSLMLEIELTGGVFAGKLESEAWRKGDLRLTQEPDAKVRGVGEIFESGDFWDFDGPRYQS